MVNASEKQASIDKAQADLEHRVGELKDLIDEKLVVARHVLRALRSVATFARKHTLQLGIGAIAAGAGAIVVHQLRARR